ncbi:MAG: hypothetical protein K2Y22_02525 [Candidatus Obscuribacterales bacterium]|nr:hypothetical protein [Candidatus Obscuribacterales bacterium]
MFYRIMGTVLVLQAMIGIACFGQGDTSSSCQRDELLKRETYLREAKSQIQLKLNRTYERINKMKMRAAELENGLTQIDDHLRKVSSAIVELDR